MVLAYEMEGPLSRREQLSLNPLPSTEQKKQMDSFRMRLHEEILRSSRHHYTFSLIRLAVDANDEAKQDPTKVLEFLRSVIRTYDIVCAVKQGEYAIAFPETTGQTAGQIASRLKESVLQKKWANAVSDAMEPPAFGIACFPKDGTTAEDLLRSSERNLLKSKLQK